jgi:hypothetical protein
MKLSKDEIIRKMEELKDGETMKFTIPATFGGGMAVIELNPNYPKAGGKKYILKVGKDEKVNPYFDSDKSKDLAKWVTDRMGELV